VAGAAAFRALANPSCSCMASGATWSEAGVMPNLAKDHMVIAFDRRGHGKSDKPRDPRKYGAESGQDIVRLLDHLGIARAHIIGYSAGAVTTVSF
jgi:pimeloyl-ACP methyl ester carboxylesterase